MIALVALVSWPVGLAVGGGSGDAAVITSPGGSTTVRMAEDSTLEVEGAQGPVEVRVSDGSLRVVHAQCPDQVCVRTGAIASAGSVVACVPNGVVIRVTGGGGVDDLDARIR